MSAGGTPSQEQVREFVIEGHGNLEKVKQMLAQHPELLNAANEWKEGDRETAIQAAAHVGNRVVAEYLLANGAPLDICTVSMLGRKIEVERMLAGDPALIRAAGAHGIPLLTHAALSGNVELMQMLVDRGARGGMSSALSSAVSKGHLDMVRWILEHGEPDLGWKNFQGKTAMDIAVERGAEDIARLLRAHGAQDPDVETQSR